MQSALYNIFKQKANKYRKKYIKNQKIKNVSIDSVRGFLTYPQLKKFINDKAFSQRVDFKNNEHKFLIKGTGIYIKIIAKEHKIYYVAYGLSQYYTRDNAENRKKLENILINTKITSVDIAYDSDNMIKLHTPRGSQCQTFRNSTYFLRESLKICLYNKREKAKKTQNTAYKKHSQKLPTWRLEITLQISAEHLNKNKKLKRKHSTKARNSEAKKALNALIEKYNIKYNTRCIEKNKNFKNETFIKTILKTKSIKERLKMFRKVFLYSLDNKNFFMYNSDINQRKRLKIQI